MFSPFSSRGENRCTRVTGNGSRFSSGIGVVQITGIMPVLNVASSPLRLMTLRLENADHSLPHQELAT
jgi:hypothetical protein